MAQGVNQLPMKKDKRIARCKLTRKGQVLHVTGRARRSLLCRLTDPQQWLPEASGGPPPPMEDREYITLGLRDVRQLLFFFFFLRNQNFQNLIQKLSFALKMPSLLRLSKNLKCSPNVPMGFLTRNKVIAEEVFR